MIPTSLITRSTLDGVAQIYQTNVLPTDPDTCVLWDCLQVAGCEVLAPKVEGLEQGSALHRWIVLDAIQSAESVPQGAEDKAAIEAARVWVANPSEENRVAASSASYVAAAYYAAYNTARAAAASYAAPAYAANSAAYAASAAYPYAASNTAAANAAKAAYAAYAPYADASYDAARLRFRVLTTMAQAGVLPEPEMK
jgi:hypothetical protein